mmetsp:Transcript_6289/g.15632  ORF Transcript_6289/g.15632 Transcript_6289/m.15632 type:complete len:271 (+) Transcript_6289:115-927(+)
MASSGRIDIAGQMGRCDTSAVTISRSMPAVLSGHINDFAWKSFCDKMDEALKPTSAAKKKMTIGSGITMGVGILFIIVGFITFGTQGMNSVNSFGESGSPMIGFAIFGAGMAIMIIGGFGSSFYGNSVAVRMRDGIRKVCEETSALHPGVSFHVRDEVQFWGYRTRRNDRYGYGGGGYDRTADVTHTNYIEVSVSNQAVGSALPSALGYAPPSAPAYIPVAAVAHQPEANVVVSGIAKTPAERMRELDQMKGLLTEGEYHQKRAEILSDV